MESEIMVSVLCAAYNHEQYIRQCLDGFVMQKTNFKYEVLINDDASTDNTAQIIREYQEKYPEIIKPIYQTENQYSKGVKITTGILAPQAKGKYIALCEGDDYWCDENKLQLQVNAMQDHPECKMCIHKVKGFFETKTKSDYYPPFALETGSIDSYEFIKITQGYIFQTSSYFFNAESFKEYIKENPVFKQISPVGDVCFLLYFGNKAPVYYIDKQMSCYRKESIGSVNWNWRLAGLKKHKQDYCVKINKVYMEYDKYTNGKYHELMLLRMFYTKRDYKALLFSKELKAWRKSLSLKKRVYYFLKAYFPWLAQILLKISHRE